LLIYRKLSLFRQLSGELLGVTVQLIAGVSNSDLAPDVENTIFHQIATSLIGFQALEMGFLLMVQDLRKGGTAWNP
jgi:hypothetical protein